MTILINEISVKEKAARDLEAQAGAIDAAVFDLKAVNPSTVAKFDDRSPAEIIQSIHDNDRVVAEALARLASLVGPDDANVPRAVLRVGDAHATARGFRDRGA